MKGSERMSREIKTRENYKDIKVLDKSIHGMKRMRQASIRAKESNPQEQISKGATTIWEHWDGLMESGDFWCDEMNSFNHYAYGAVADWVFEKALGIQVVEEYPGFAKVRIAPKVDERLGWLEGSFHTRHG